MTLAIIVALSFSVLATRWLARPGNPLLPSAAPNARSLHRETTPSGGGLAIVGVVVAAEIARAIAGAPMLFPGPWTMAGFLAIAAVSWIDDHRPLPALLRGLVHLAAALALPADGLTVDRLPLPGLVEGGLPLGAAGLVVTVLAAIWLTNLFNFMDGMDGFAGGMAVIGFGGCAALLHAGGAADLAFLCALIAAAAAGFLVWNFPPARIFMGDVGAAPLGYAVAVVASGGVHAGAFGLWQPLLIFSPFWVDATVTLLRRTLRGERPWTPHRTHLYQRLALSSWGTRRTTLSEYGLMALCAGAALLYGDLGEAGRGLTLLAAAAFYALLFLRTRTIGRAAGSSEREEQTSEPVRVWMVDQNTMPAGIPGGTRHYEIGQHLLREGYAVEVVTSDFHISEHRHLRLRWPRLWKSEDFDGLRWRWLWASAYRRNDWKRYLNLLSFGGSLFAFGLFRRRPQVIVGSSPHLVAAFAAFLLARVSRCAFYLEVRDLWPQVLVDMGGKPPQSFLVRVLGWMERVLYRRAQAVLLLAPRAVDYVQERGVAEDKIVLMPNGVQLPDPAALPPRSEARAEFGLEPGRFVLVYAGAHGTANSLKTLVDAAALIEERRPGRFRVLLVGAGMEKDALQERGRDVAPLRFLDPLPKDRLRRLLHGADALVLTLLDVPVFRYGISPRKLYDYYAAARPVVVNVGGAVNEEVERHACGVTAPPEDPGTLADAILDLEARDEEEREAMGARGRQLAESDYDMSVIATRLTARLRRDFPRPG